MKWSWTVGKLAGIEMRIHGTFLLLLGWVVLSHYIDGHGAAAMLMGLAFILALFACVVLHELGHALAARRMGIATRDITLLPVGGVARLERIPEAPPQELWIALAGPAVNLAIAAVLFVFLQLTHDWEPVNRLRLTAGPFFERLLAANVSLVLFNLIPAFPMDGGRVLRALLATRMPYLKATRTAAAIGQGFAVVFGFVGLFVNPILLAIAVFVWFGASQEAAAAPLRRALAGSTAAGAMLTRFDTLRSADTLADAVRLSLAGAQRDFPVVEFGQVTGMLARADMLAALADRGPGYRVAFAMRPVFPVAEWSEPLEAVSRRLQEWQCDSMPVIRNGRMVGLFTSENLGEHLLIESILREGRRNPEVLRPAV